MSFTYREENLGARLGARAEALRDLAARVGLGSGQEVGQAAHQDEPDDQHEHGEGARPNAA
jgi:hypothetical protein